MARPGKYKRSFHPESYLELSILGYTKAEICKEWGICRDTLNSWSKDPDKIEFADAYKKGEVAREAWFIKIFKDIGLGNISNANLGAFIWLSKNCLNWSDEASGDLGFKIIHLKNDLKR